MPKSTKNILLSVFFIFCLFLVSNNNVYALEQPPDYVKTIGTRWKGMVYALSITTDSQNNIYVSEGFGSINGSIEKFDENGNYISNWTGFNNINGQIDGSSNKNQPRGIYVTGPGGNLYTLESGSNAVKEYDSNGNLLKQWGSLGAGNGQFNNPWGITMDAGGNIYVADTGNNRIQKFDSNGNFIMAFGTLGSGDGQFNSPYSVRVDSNGNIWVPDYNNNCIQKFGSDGTFLAKYGSAGTGNGQFNKPIDLSFDSNGNIYILEYSGNRIQKFDSSMNFITKWGSLGVQNAQFTSPFSITIDTKNNIYVADHSDSFSRIQKFDSNGNYITQWGNYGSDNGQFNYPTDLVFDTDNNFYIVEKNNHRIQKFDKDGNYLIQVSSSTLSNSVFITVDLESNVYVQLLTGVVQKYDKNLNFIKSFGTNITDLAVDKDDNIYAIQKLPSKILKMDTDGNILDSWGVAGSGTGQLGGTITGMAIDGNYIYLGDRSNRVIHKFDLDGNFINDFGAGGSGADFSLFYGMAVDSKHNIYAVEYQNPNSSVFKFDSDGNYLGRWGMRGYYGDHNLAYPTGIAINSEDNIYVVNSNMNNVKVYAYHATPIAPSIATPITPGMISCDPTLYTTTGYLSPKPGGLPACGEVEQITTSPATITFSDGSVVYIINSTTTNQVVNPLYNGNNTETNSPLFNTNKLTKDLSLGSTGADVKSLQIYLNTHGYTIATSGSGSTGNETNYFGTLTQKALSKFQKDNNISPAVGYFGVKTRAFISSH